jgi:tRNA threonylcarbamoyladenosine biosynthesis protein TsaE
MISNSLEETKKIAYEFASSLKGGDVVFLEGDLGVGKTTFVQGVLESLGYTEPVRSPTFSIMNLYPIMNHETIKQVIHLDFYRFETPEEIRSLGLEEMMIDTKNVFMIEWPEKGLEKESKMKYNKVIKFISLPNGAREIII